MSAECRQEAGCPSSLLKEKAVHGRRVEKSVTKKTEITERIHPVDTLGFHEPD